MSIYDHVPRPMSSLVSYTWKGCLLGSVDGAMPKRIAPYEGAAGGAMLGCVALEEAGVVTER